ncbi:MAG TPA: efflux RND transporter permease subunit, partial [Bacillota bacterium]|nr:efflux RND transporter permease subunit [Bacillota bacterium]
MSLNLLPNINLPYAVIITTYPGAAPEAVESVVTDTLEQAMATINNIKEIQSVSSDNMSYIMLEFNEDTNMDSSIIEIRECLDIVGSYLPDEVGTPMIMKVNPDMMPVLVASAYIEGKGDRETAKYIEEKIVPALKSIEGAAAISATGLVENYVNVMITDDNIDSLNERLVNHFTKRAEAQIRVAARAEIVGQIDKGIEDQIESLSAFGMRREVSEEMFEGARDELMAGIDDQVERIVAEELEKIEIPRVDISQDLLEQVLSAQNFSMPAGSIPSQNGAAYLVRVGDRIQGLEELRSMVVLDIPEYGQVTLGDLAKIYKSDNTDHIYSRVNDNYAVMLTMQKQPGYSTTDVTNDFVARAEALTKEHEGLSFEYLINQGDYVNMMIDTVLSNLLFGAGLAVLILMVFLRRIKPTFIVAASIATSVITAFVLMYFSGVTLNVISMGGLALGVGMLVDNSIVVIENIYRMMSEGMSARGAALKGAREVAGPIFSSTLTTIIVFLPIVFIRGLTRQIFTDMALTIGFSLTASLLTALTLVPAASAAYLKNKDITNKTFSPRLSSAYARVLNKSLKYKGITITLCVVLFALSILAALNSGRVLLPYMDSESITMQVRMPQSYNRDDSFNVLDKLYQDLSAIEDIDTIGIMCADDSRDEALGLVNMMAGSDATLNILLDGKDRRPIAEIKEDIRAVASKSQLDVKISDTNQDINSISGGKVVINIFGEDTASLKKAALEAEQIVKAIEGTTEVDNGLGRISEELRITVDKARAIGSGVTVAQVFTAINQAISAQSPITSIEEEDGNYSLLVTDNREQEIREDTLATIEVVNTSGSRVKVEDLTQIHKAEGFSSIQRLGRQRYISVRASLKPGYSSGIVNKNIEGKFKSHRFSSDIHWAMAGEQAMIKKTYTDLLKMLILAIIFIYLVMVAQFQSLLSPLIVMFTIPLGFTGGFLALYLAGMPISAVALIGLVLLIGIVVNNGIVFIDYANIQMNKGLGKKEALLHAAKNRIRPILMTALTTIFALITMVFDTTMGGELMRPMAVVTIGGLTYSAILTLFLVPALYMVLKKEKKAQ